MCKNATATAGAIMKEERVTLVALLPLLGVPASTVADVLAAYDAADADLINWQPGTTSTTLIESLNAAVSIINAIPEIPADAKMLVNVIIAGLEAVITIVEANSPAPVEAADPMPPPAMAENFQSLHAHAMAAQGEAKVAARIGYKPSLFTKARVMVGDHGAAASQYKSQWNHAVEKSDPKYSTLRQN